MPRSLTSTQNANGARGGSTLQTEAAGDVGASRPLTKAKGALVAMKVRARRWRRKAKTRRLLRRLMVAAPLAADPRALLLADLLELAIEDPEAAGRFCSTRIPHWFEGCPINPYDRPKEAAERLSTAQSLIRAVAHGICRGSEEEWMRLHRARRSIEERPGIMELRKGVVSAILAARALYETPCVECPGCLTYNGEERCQRCGRILSLVEDREFVAARLQGDLEQFSDEFRKLEIATILRILAQNSVPTKQAAKLSISVGAFGDKADERKVAKLFAAGWASDGPRAPARAWAPPDEDDEDGASE